MFDLEQTAMQGGSCCAQVHDSVTITNALVCEGAVIKEGAIIEPGSVVGFKVRCCANRKSPALILV